MANLPRGTGKGGEKYITILEDARFRYTPTQLKKFVAYWNNGASIKIISKAMKIKHVDVALLVIHCELEDLIKPREGGLMGFERGENDGNARC